MIRKTLIAASAALALAAPNAGAWTSDTFRSPTGNLVCKYRYNYDAITCAAFNTQLVIRMSATGRPTQGYRLSWDRNTAWPVLSYGQAWNRGANVSCRSLSTGMRCQNRVGWYFLISRSGIVVGRFGQDFYRLPS